MAISTYTELKASIADFLNRDDITSVIPDFISLSEAQMERELRHWRGQKKASISIGARYVPVPADLVQLLRLHLDDGYSTKLSLITMDEMLEYRMNTGDAVGKPRYYCITADNIEVFPTPDITYTAEILYYETLDKLSDSTSSNWVLSYHPDAYLYGALLQSAPYLKDDVRINVWSVLYAGAVGSINNDSNKARSGGSGLRLRINSYRSRR